MKQSDKKDLNIIYLDNHLLAVDKPAGILTQPDNTGSISIEVKAKDFLKKKCNKDKVFLHAVHRIDKQVEGVVLFARTSKALSRINKQIREKKVKKTYLALVEGKIKEKKAILKNYIIHASHMAKIVNKNIKDAKLAVLEYKVIEEIDNTSLVEINLITGRYHQIRAQFSNIGHPIVGDKKYGSKKDLKKIKLKAVKLEIFHPTLQKKMIFKIESSFSCM